MTTRCGTVLADHHQFVLGSPLGETYRPEQTGSVLEIGANFATIVTGITHGPVDLTIEVHEDEPPLPADTSSWGAIEEATVKFTKAAHVLTLDGRAAQGFSKLPIRRGLYRFRVFAHGRDARPAPRDTAETERYLVQIWKTAQPKQMERLHKTDSVGNDEIVTHPTPNWWDPDPAGDASLYIRFGYDRMAEWAKQEAIQWGGRPPSAKLRRNLVALGIAGRDRALADAITRARVPKLRRIAAWAARRAYTRAGLAEIDWIRPALDALDAAESLPHPFGPRETPLLRKAFEDDPAIDDVLPAVGIALHIVATATAPDPLNAAFQCLDIAARTDDSNYAALIADLRREFFPELMPIEKYERWI
ncbi:transposase [Rhodococcus sp. C26F]